MGDSMITTIEELKKRILSSKIVENENVTLCWTCKNAIGKCSWSNNFEPIENWEATPTHVGNNINGYHSYKVIKCPSFEYDGEYLRCKHYSKDIKQPETFYQICPNFYKSYEFGCKNFNKKRNGD